MTTPDLEAAAAAVGAAGKVVTSGIGALAAGSLDDNQVLAYDVAHAAAAVEAARTMLDYGGRGPVEAGLTTAFVADVVAGVAAAVFGRESLWGVAADALDGAREFVAAHRDPAFLASVADAGAGPSHLDDDFEL